MTAYTPDLDANTVDVASKLNFPWVSRQHDGATVHTAGGLTAGDKIVAAARAGEMGSLSALLAREQDTFGLIVETPSHVVAATDKVRGYPVYIRQNGRRSEIATGTAQWTEPANAEELDEARVGTFLAAGYTIGEHTLFSSIRRLLPGEAMLADRATGRVSYTRYYQFRPRFPDPSESPDFWEEKLEAALDAAAERVIARADGAKIWVPLSAGLDSRAVLAKLLSSGYDRIETFSFGIPGNMESRVASELADKAGVSWRHVPSLPDNPIEAFRSDDVTNYYFSGSGLGTTPAMTEFFPLRGMMSDGLLSEGDYIVNGQSGDYLTGAHIPPAETHREVADYILKKHFALFRSENEQIGQKGAETVLQDWSRRYMGAEPSALDNSKEAIALYLTFECQERQCQYVVQQQRLYDYFGLRWALPLWDGELMDVFEDAPMHEHRNQALYWRYLHRWNYKGLFDEGRRPYNPWPKYSPLIRTAARVAGLFGGRAAKERAYKDLYYWSERHYLYALFGRRIHRALIDEIRGPVSLFTVDYMSRLRRSLGVAPRRPAEIAYAELDDGLWAQ